MKRTICLILLLAFVFTGCKDERRKATLAASKNLWNSVALVAIDREYFAEEGIDLTVSYLDAGRFCMDAVLSNSADFGNVVDVNVGYLAFSKNRNIVLINEISGCQASEIVARKSRGINSPADLRGKTLAFSPGTTSDIFARRFLTKYGLDEQSVKFVKIQPKGMVAGMVAADGPDAASTWQPFVSTMRKGLKDDMISFSSPEIYTAREFTAVRSEWARKNKDVIVSYLKALQKSQTFIQEHKGEAQKIVARMTGLDLAIVQESWEAYQITSAYNKDRYLQEITQIGMEISRQDEFKGKKVPDYSAFLDDSYFKSVK